MVGRDFENKKDNNCVRSSILLEKAFARFASSLLVQQGEEDEDDEGEKYFSSLFLFFST